MKGDIKRVLAAWARSDNAKNEQNKDVINGLTDDKIQLNADVDELLLVIGGTPINAIGHWFDRIKALYDAGRVTDLKAYVRAGLLTTSEYQEICGEPYEE